MELTKLFKVQEELKKHIGYKGEDMFPKMMLAMLVEFMESANEWRGFKYWSKDQKPKVSKAVECYSCSGKGVELDYGDMSFWDCYTCDGTGELEEDANPLLEEYVDGLHFVLETGLDMLENGNIRVLPKYAANYQSSYEKGNNSIIRQYKQLTHTVLYIDREAEVGSNYLDAEYGELIKQYLYLGSLLGFTEEQIVQAYMKKNEVNHQRQESGY